MTDPTIETFAASDGYPLRWRRYHAIGTPRGHVVAIHGIQSHGGWYDASSRHLAAAGHHVAFLDRRGSGLNEAARGDCPSFRRLLLDIAEFIATLPEKPVLSAISWGGKLALAHELFHPGLTRGLVLLAPGICPKVGPPVWTRFRIALARLFSPASLFPVPLDDPTLFTANAIRQQFIRDDPLALRRATARFLVESVRLDWVMRRAPAAVTVPTLLVLAEHDRIIDNAATRAFMGRLSSPDRTVLQIAGAHHTLEFEPDPLPAFDAVRRWLAARVK